MLSEGLLLLTPVPPAGDKPPLPKGGGREAAGGFRVSAGAPVESLHPRLRRRSPSLSQGRLCPAGDVGCRARRPRRAVPSRSLALRGRRAESSRPTEGPRPARRRLPPLPKGGGREAAGGFRLAQVLRWNPSTPAFGGGPPPFCKGGFALRGTWGVGRDDPGAPSPRGHPALRGRRAESSRPTEGPRPARRSQAPLAKGGRPRSGGGIPSERRCSGRIPPPPPSAVVPLPFAREAGPAGDVGVNPRAGAGKHFRKPVDKRGLFHIMEVWTLLFSF
ncbi:hypothetical protein N510_002492 [Firmicutes bacterium ASF500]|nr:hypothetical protein N510_002492 [Firmicutes bacterium ASF500]